MDLKTTPVLELSITYTLKEDEIVDVVANELREEFERLGIEETMTVNTGSEEGGRYTMTIFIPIPRGQKLLEQLPDIALLQTRLHAVFLAASRPTPNNPGTLH